MMKKILMLIDSGNVSDTEEMARLLDSDPNLVDAALAMLVEKGYLSCASPPSSGCACCPAKSSCNPSKTARYYRLSGKAKKLIGR